MPIPLKEVLASLDPAMRKSVKERSAEIVAEHHQAMARRSNAIACTKTRKRADTIKASR